MITSSTILSSSISFSPYKKGTYLQRNLHSFLLCHVKWRVLQRDMYIHRPPSSSSSSFPFLFFSFCLFLLSFK
eukprot:gene599-328_t